MQPFSLSSKREEKTKGGGSKNPENLHSGHLEKYPNATNFHQKTKNFEAARKSSQRIGLCGMQAISHEQTKEDHVHKTYPSNDDQYKKNI